METKKSWRDTRSGIIQGVRPMLNEKRVFCKGGVFSAYNHELQETELIEGKIKGLYLCSALKLSCFDPKFGKQGGTYSSNYIFDTRVQSVSIFAPTGDKIFSGMYSDAKNYLTANCNGVVKTFQVFFILTENGIYAVHTNICIGIEQINKHSYNLQFNFIVLEAKTYNSDEMQLEAKTKKALGKFIDKNPPVFADLSVGEEISDEWATTNEALKYIELMDSYKKYCLRKEEIDLEGEAELTHREIKKLEANYNKKEGDEFIIENENTDLPF